MSCRGLLPWMAWYDVGSADGEPTLMPTAAAMSLSKFSMPWPKPVVMTNLLFCPLAAKQVSTCLYAEDVMDALHIGTVVHAQRRRDCIQLEIFDIGSDALQLLRGLHLCQRVLHPQQERKVSRRQGDEGVVVVLESEL